MNQEPIKDVQAGIEIGDFAGDTDREVATGDRREDVHFEPDSDQIVRVAHQATPSGTPAPDTARKTDPPTVTPAQMTSSNGATIPDGPSVWDARPRDAETIDRDD